MADHTVHSTGPVASTSAPAGRSPNQPSHRQHAATPRRRGAADSATVHPAAAVALRLLRERVLARTRALLELDDAPLVPAFAEVVEAEAAPAFLGRLLSAQNQIAARRAAAWPPDRVRDALGAAFVQGAAETIEVLAADAAQGIDGVMVVAEVLAEHGRRLAALASAPAAPA
ncbi:MAG: hypothetical protein FJ265_01735 [Planctomycetes bacterium]|nr:hypothetical protein [Planctomycetota bacterium]